MLTFNLEEIEKYILDRTTKDDEHIIWADNNVKRKGDYNYVTFNKINRAVHHWLYICKTHIDPSNKIRLKRICEHNQCINPEHQINMDDKNSIYELSSYYLKKNSVQDGDCRLWTGTLNVDGYGCASFKGKHQYAHIISMLIYNKIEKIPSNLIVRHRCPNQHKHCIAIEHLKLGTHKDNSADKIIDGTSLIGSKNPSAIINEETAKKIYDLKKTMTQKDRSIMFNVGIGIVNSIDNGITWSHVTGQEKREKKRKKIVIDENTPVDIYLSAQQRIKNNITKVYDEIMKEYHWIWQLALDTKGYGRCEFGGKKWGAHAVAWMAFNKKPIPPGLIILHKCKQQTACCNPDHLAVGTFKENSADMKQIGTMKIPRKITEEVASAIMLSKGDGTIQDRSNRFGVSQGIIKQIDSGKQVGNLHRRF